MDNMHFIRDAPIDRPLTRICDLLHPFTFAKVKGHEMHIYFNDKDPLSEPEQQTFYSTQMSAEAPTDRLLSLLPFKITSLIYASTMYKC